MADVKAPSPVKLIIAVIFTSEGILIQAKSFLRWRLGLVDWESQILPFEYTQYYRQQMGENLRRQVFSFQRLINPEKLAAIKLYTNGLEKRLTRTQSKVKRAINLDPGYVCRSKLVLATCKNYSHRIYLKKGIYAEVTLGFHNGSFAAWPWTYPDYKSTVYIQMFNKIRQLYIIQLKD